MTQVLKEKTYYLENVCANCPGSLWGEKSICRIHDKHIGKVESCPEWEHRESPQDQNGQGEQLALFDLEPAVEVVQKVEEDLRNYRWMKVRVDQLRRGLGDAGEGTVRQYGIESILPKPKGGNTDPVNREVNQRLKDWERLIKLEKKVKAIEEFTISLTDEKEREILECILDNWRMKDIAFHVGISRQRLNEIRKIIVKKMAWNLYGEELKGA